MNAKNPLRRFGVAMEKNLLKQLDGLCARKGYQSRSEAIRDLVRDSLIEDHVQDENAETVGTVTIIYDHHQRELGEKLTSFQHRHLNIIVSALHVHLNAHLCLEVLILRGKIKDIKKIADGLIATKGVQHGKLVVTTQDHGTHSH